MRLDEVKSETYSDIVLQQLLGSNFLVLRVHCYVLWVVQAETSKVLH